MVTCIVIVHHCSIIIPSMLILTTMNLLDAAIEMHAVSWKWEGLLKPRGQSAAKAVELELSNVAARQVLQ